MKKSLCAAIALTIAAGSALAVTPVLTVDGLQIDKNVTHLTFDGDNVLVHYGESDHDAYDMESVRIDFKDASGIEEIGTLAGVSLEGDEIVFAGVAEGTPVAVYDASGRTVGRYRAAASEGRIGIDPLPAGVYVLAIGNEVVKFIKK